MTDDTDGLPPEQDAVRRLLASTRDTDGVPDAVVARLDDVLAGLVAERAAERQAAPEPAPATAGPPGATVVPLPTRRRRVLAWSMAAAAAVVVGGVALGQLPGPTGSQSDDAISSSEAEESSGAAADSSSGLRGMSSEGEGVGAALSSGSLERDLVLLRASGEVFTPRSQLLAAGCLPPVTGERFQVTLDGVPAVAVLGPVTPDGQRARVYRCGDDRPAASTVLPAP
jgi:hypothetical protein